MVSGEGRLKGVPSPKLLALEMAHFVPVASGPLLVKNHAGCPQFPRFLGPDDA
jgi:hypothetical protein